MRENRWHNIEALRRGAHRMLPRPIFDYIDGGAEDEVALRRSTAAFDRYELLPRMLTDVSTVSTETEIFGHCIPFPLILSPTGLTRLFHHDAELAVAQAASASGIPYCLSTLGTTTIEEFGHAMRAPKLFQIYIFKDRGLTEEFVERARAGGYDGLVLTVDTPMAGKRERDLLHGLTLPPRLTPQGFLGFASKPRWSIPALFGRKFDFVNVAHRVTAMSGGTTSLQEYVNGQFDRSLTWKDVDWLAARWNGPLAIKGILRSDDARNAVDAGADIIMVSNHGGRQLESAAAPIDQIAPIADALGGRAKIICDGGIRRGSHIVKALALGADACSIGRPYLYGLAAAGSQGVERAILLLRDEVERCMVLSGARSLGELDRSIVGLSAFA
ncbi:MULTISPECIES: alpha-hydroxy acid oxidase [unclassified Sphingobium]|uniref:alpha-hydroxy acid oxidase n=1 Tax=unclassified Sphingobium TaxID=2611147 RepID=UPI00076FE937|nr:MULTISPECIES: alpha-hydroxy acid oxidase [unclassified Sphingobium]AMK21105.1 (S)-2-hydroxy-acid oxidase [Sphingobium sp. TKS]NML89691.1 alpha-hydroxy-acid oxidizing protein [Sphingobium sp. TB-6]